jgi:uncharacterized membrane protein
MKRKPRNRIAALAGSLSAIAGSSLALSQGMGVWRHYFLTGMVVVSVVLLVLILAACGRGPNQAS